MATLLSIGAILLGLAVVGPILARLIVAYRKKMAEIEEMEVMARRFREEAHQALAQTEVVRNEIEALEQERVELQDRLRPMEESISAEALAMRPRIYMPTDKFSAWDEEYVVIIGNNTFDPSSFHVEAVESWRRGRRHVFWAQSQDQVRALVEARFPSALGYEIRSLEISADRLIQEVATGVA